MKQMKVLNEKVRSNYLQCISYFIFVLMFIGLIPFSANSQGNEHKYYDEIINDLIVYRAHADGFEKFSEREKKLAYYLYKAAIAGRDMYFDEMHKDSLAIRTLLGKTLTYGKNIDEKLYDDIKYYTYLFYNFGCNYNLNTDFSKILPPFSFYNLKYAVDIANQNGADIDINELSSYAKVIFDPDYEPYLKVSNNTEKSAGNFYSGIRTSEVNDFYNYYMGITHFDEEGNLLGEIGLNTRLVKERGKIFEQLPDELYPIAIQKMVYYLEKAQKYASTNQKEYLESLIKYLEGGDVYDWHLFNKKWATDEVDIDFMIGFVEVYEDPMNRKGSYEGIVHFIDEEGTKRQQLIVDNAQYYEDNAPWDDKYKKVWKKLPVAKTINILTETGAAQTCCIAGINLPNEQYLREKYGSKNVAIKNTGDAIDKGFKQAYGDFSSGEFSLPEEREEAKKYKDNKGFDAFVDFHEITGHGGGKMAPGNEGISPDVAIGGYFNTLEECRANSVGLWNLLDPKTHELGLVSREVAELEYRGFVRGVLTMLRNFPDANEIVEAHRASENLIVRYIMANTDSIVQKVVEGKTYFVVNDIDGMRKGVGDLLAEIQRIKSEVDPAGAKFLVETYGRYLDKNLRDEVISRYKVLEEKYNIPKFRVMIHPRLMLKNGDVIVDYSESFLEQQLRYDSANSVRLIFR